MRYYETVYIINPNFEQSRVDSIIKEIDKYMGEFSKVISHNMWGKKKLAYQIDGQKYGTFVLLHFESDNSIKISDFESFMKLNSSVLRAQTIRLKSKPTASLLEKTITVDLDEADGAIEKQPSKETKSSKGSAEEASAENDDNTADEVKGSAEEASAENDDNTADEVKGSGLDQ
jgi:small subunit ribosomal protein S6